MHSPAAGGGFLLIRNTASGTCLSCHEGATDTGPSSYHVSTTGTNPTTIFQRTPGGDFGWIKKTYTYTYNGTTFNETGSGHNVIANDFGYFVDADNPTAPGGSGFPSNQLACNSCHDPHGQYRRRVDGTIGKNGGAIWASGSYPGGEPKTFSTGEPLAVGVYRLLAGAGYVKDGITFPGVPAAKVPSSYNAAETNNQTRVAYGVATTGGHVQWGTWCATCHPNMHSAPSRYVHPVDESLGSTIAGLYNSYVKSGDMTGDNTKSYSSLVPFVTGSSDYTALATLAVRPTAQGTVHAGNAGPASNDQVSCLSCHRAHASGFSHALRFDQGYEFMTKEGNYIGSDNTAGVTGSRAPLQHRGRTIADWDDAYYDRPASQFSAYQRVLCNKCHAKD
jgi:hypothetical protein